MNSAATVALFVGSGDVALIESIVSRYHDGFTVIPAIGYWHGNRESSAVVIINDYHDIGLTVSELKSELYQESIAVDIWPTMRFT